MPRSAGSAAADGFEVVAVQADGKVILAGSGFPESATRSDFIVRRLTATGAVDTSFGSGGRVVLSPAITEVPGLSAGKATAITIQTDGSVLVAGRIFGNDLTVVKLTADGQFVSGFGDGGKAFLSLGSAGGVVSGIGSTIAGLSGPGVSNTLGNAVGNVFTPHAITTLADGRILVAGELNQDFAVVRLNANGQLDTTFGDGGKAIAGFETDVVPRTDSAAAMVVQPDGKIVLAGTTTVTTNIIHSVLAQSKFAVARLTASGQLDSSFDGDGKLIVSFDRGGGIDEATGVALRPDGHIVVAGLAGYDLPFLSTIPLADMAAVQLNPDGSLDTSFGTGGKVIAQFDTIPGRDSRAAGLTILPSGKVVLVGSVSTVAAVSRFAATRLNVNGSIDTTFGKDGFFRAGLLGPRADVAFGVAALGKVVAVGSSLATDFVTPIDPFAVRFFIDPVLPGAVLVGGSTTGNSIVANPTDGSLTVGPEVKFFPGFGGTVRTAIADVTGDGVADFIGVTGPGGGPVVKVIDGTTNNAVAEFFAFETTFTGGLYVAAADLDGDGKAEVIVTPDQGGGPVVAVYSGAKLAAGKTGDEAQVVRFLGIEDEGFRGGVRPSVGDINGDGTPDLVVAAGFLGGPRIAVYDGKDVAAGNQKPRRLVDDFFAFEETLRNGTFVAVGDVDGDGFADLAVGGGPGGSPRVRLFSGKELLRTTDLKSLDTASDALQLANFFAGGAAPRGGVRLSLRDVDGDNKADLVAGSGEGEAAKLRVYKSQTLLARSDKSDQELDVFGNAALANGVFVG